MAIIFGLVKKLGTVPDDSKKANVIPAFKAGYPADEGN